MNDRDFLTDTASTLAALPAVRAVALGGSRAQGQHRPDSDWDLAVYYRGPFDPAALRDVGWAGEVFDIGAWGGGVFNGGAWLTVDGRRVDVHYRDLASVEHELSESAGGRFRIEPLLFHLAGIPTYLVVAELAINQVLSGHLPRPEFPAALRRSAPEVWWRSASLIFDYADQGHARYGRPAQCVSLLTQAATMAGHAILAARGEWVTNEKTLLTRARLSVVDDIVARVEISPSALQQAVEEARSACADELAMARATLQ